MSIAIIRRHDLEPAGGLEPRGIPNVVISQLVQRAASAGKIIALRNFRLDSEAVDCLRGANDSPYEFVLFDPGEWLGERDQLAATLKQMRVPYIEVHDDHPRCPEHALGAEDGSRLCLVQGYCSQGYTLALSMALEHLGCSECENDFHVGT